ncbi:MAG: GTP cyclohydrolase I [Bdellovibrionota bacterium]
MKTQFQKILDQIHPEVDIRKLEKTATRAQNAYRKVTNGYSIDAESLCKKSLIENSERKSIVIASNIFFISMCEHHLMPFFGTCHIVYEANKYIIGLSKITAIVEAYAHRLQLQEKLTQEIAACLFNHLQPFGVGVYMQADHCCLKLTHTEAHSTQLTTLFGLGSLQKSHELSLILQNKDIKHEHTSLVTQ